MTTELEAVYLDSFCGNAEMRRLHAEVLEQARLNGMGAEREARLMARVEELERENESLRTDAERYRMVRRGQQWSVINGIGYSLRAEALDAAIDAARSEA